MVRNEQPWELGEPELNARGQPVIHTIASKLGCIPSSNDIELIHYVFPEDETGLAELATQLQSQHEGGYEEREPQNDRAAHTLWKAPTSIPTVSPPWVAAASTPENSAYNDLAMQLGRITEPSSTFTAPCSTSAVNNQPTSMEFSEDGRVVQCPTQRFMNRDGPSQGFLESDLDILNPQMLYPNSEGMMGMGGPTICSISDVSCTVSPDWYS